MALLTTLSGLGSANGSCPDLWSVSIHMYTCIYMYMCVLFPTQFVAGGLSMRMRQPGSLWQEAWSAAEPVPAHRQKKLFNDTREAEKVLHYLAGLKTAELGLLVLPLLTHCAIHALKDKHGIYMKIRDMCLVVCSLHKDVL